MESLLEKAKKIKSHKYIRNDINDKDKRELALAWIKNEIGMTQAAKAIKCRNSTTYVHLALGLKKAFLDGKLKLK